MNFKKQILLSLVLLVQVALMQAETFYVSEFGSNSENGTVSAPWKTLNYACGQVPEGSTIRLQAGTIMENTVCIVPRHVSIIGAGEQLTILKSAFYYTPISEWDIARDKYLIQLVDGSNGAQISDFSIDGDMHKSHAALKINAATNLTVSNLTINNFNFNAIWLTNSDDVLVSNINLRECSLPASHSCSGMLMIAGLNRVNIVDSDFFNETKAHGGYGIKSWNPQWNVYENWKVDGSQVVLNYVNIERCNFNIYPRGAWNNGNSPNICVEFYASSPTYCTISECLFTGNVSLVGAATSAKATYSVRILNNRFIMPTFGNRYAIENDHNKVEIAYNYIYGGAYPIASWDVSHTPTNVYVHHNVFFEVGQPDGIMLFQNAPKNLRFENNTVYLNQSIFSFNGSPKVGMSVFSIKKAANADSILVRNNIFYCENGAKVNNADMVMAGDLATVKRLTVYNNCFSNWKPIGSSYYEQNPQFLLQGTDFKTRFALVESSPVYSKNVGAILTYATALNEINATKNSNFQIVAQGDKIKIRAKVGSQATLVFYSMKAEIIRVENLHISENETFIDTDNFQKGLYIVRLYNNNEQTSMKFLKF